MLHHYTGFSVLCQQISIAIRLDPVFVHFFTLRHLAMIVSYPDSPQSGGNHWSDKMGISLNLRQFMG